jgi:CheY-like chemotaxis protein
MLQNILGMLGYDVKQAGDGAHALTLVAVFEPDLVLLDLHMPVMSGLEALDHLRRDYPAIPVVIVTGDTDEQLAQRTLRGGAVGYVVKPFTVDRLSQAVTIALRAKG